MVVVGDLDRKRGAGSGGILQRRFSPFPLVLLGNVDMPPAPFLRPLMLRSLAFRRRRRSSSILRGSFSRKQERSSMRRTSPEEQS